MSKYDKALEAVLKKMSDEKTAIAGVGADIHNLDLSLPSEDTPVPELVSWGASFAKTVLNIITLVKSTSEETGGFGKQFLTVLGTTASFVKLAGDYSLYMDEVDKDKTRGDSEDKGAFVSVLTMNKQEELILSCAAFAIDAGSLAASFCPQAKAFFEGVSILMSAYSIVQNQIHKNEELDYKATLSDVDRSLQTIGVNASATAIFASTKTEKYANEDSYLMLQPIINFILKKTMNMADQDDLDRARDIYKIINETDSTKSIGTEGLQFLYNLLEVYGEKPKKAPENIDIAQYIMMITDEISNLIQKDIQGLQLKRLFEIENLFDVVKQGDSKGNIYSYRYALIHGNSFAVLNENLYTEHNKNGELDLYDPVTGQGSLTETYLKKRAEYLQKLIAMNLGETEGFVAGDVSGFNTADQKFFDESTKTSINHMLDDPSKTLVHADEAIYFGGDGVDELGTTPTWNNNSGKANTKDFIFGGKGNDILTGWLGDDYLEGGDGDDYLYGELKDRTLLSSDVSDNDELYGGAGNDYLYGGKGKDKLVGGTDNDHLYGDRVAEPGFLEAEDEADDELYGELGNDFLYGDGGDDVLYGDGREVLYPNANISKEGLPISSDPDKPYTDKDFLDGGKGNDKLYGGLDDDILLGGQGNDILYGGYENDPTKLVEGNTDNDILYGEGGSDILFGGLGDDVLYADGRTELNQFKLDGEKTRDYTVSELLEAKTGVAGMVDVLYGGAGNDTLYAGEGINFLYGGTGNDAMYAGWHQSGGALTEVFTEGLFGGVTPSTAHDTFEGKDYFAIGRNDQDMIYNRYGFGEVAWEGGGTLAGGTYDKDVGKYVGKGGETYEIVTDNRLIAYTSEQMRAFLNYLDQKDIDAAKKDEGKVARDFQGVSIVSIDENTVTLQYYLSSGHTYTAEPVPRSSVRFELPQGTQLFAGQYFIQFTEANTLLINGTTRIYDYVQTESGAFVFLNGYVGGGAGITGYYDDKFNHQPYEKIPDDLKYLPQLGIVLKEEDEPTSSPNHNAIKTYSPIILDLDKNGVSTTGLGTYFDHDGNGFKENTGWVGSGDGFLVRDINRDGIINNGTELFGNHTVLKNGLNAANGFEALAELDDNGDGVIDAKDAAFDSLKVWVDTNGNGLTDAGELKTLTELGISSIDTQYRESGHVDSNSNEHKQTGTVTFTDGSTSEATDVWFKVNTADRIDNSNIEVSSDVMLLANAAGFGLVHDLHQAMASDSILKDMLAAVIAETDASKRSLLLDKLIYRWTGSEAVGARSRGEYIDARQLTALEKLVGSSFLGIVCDVQGKYVESSNPHSNNAPYLIEQYNKFKQFTEAQILAQGHSEFFSGIILSGFGSQVDRPVISWQKLEQALTALIAKNQIAQVKEILSIVEGLGVYSPILTQQRQAFVLALTQKEPSIQSLVNDVFFINNIDTQANILINLKTDAQFKQIKAIAFGAGVTPEDIYFVRVKDNLIIQTSNKQAIATIEDYFFYDWTFHGDNDNGYRINTLLFADGTYWAQTTLQQKVLDQMGTDGDDTITGFFDSDDVIVGGKGNDILHGRTGKDTYIFRKGDGLDTVNTGEGDYSYKGAGGQDIIIFEGIRKEELQFTHNGNDLKITYGKNDVVNILGGLNEAGRVNKIITDNGIILVEHQNNTLILKGGDINGNDLLLARNKNSTIMGSDHDETIIAIDKNNVINGGNGNDTIIGHGTLIGGNGNDIITGSYGSTIYGDAGDDIITNSKGIVFGGDGNDTITGSGSLYGGDGDDTITANSYNNHIEGGAGNDILIGFNGYEGLEYIDGGDGDDIITGHGTLIGGAGNDTITGYGVINGGLGNDTIIAKRDSSSDTFIFNLGDGQDTIYGYDIYANGYNSHYMPEDVILFGESITAEILVYQRQNNDLIILVGNIGDSITLKDYFLSSYNQTVKRLEFADGTVLRDFLENQTITQYGSAESEMLYGTAGKDIIYGNAGDDEIYSVNNYHNDNYLDGGDGNDILTGNGTLIGGAGDDELSGNGLLIGGDGNDRLYGNGTLIGGTGNDYISADTDNGVSIIKFNLGDGQDTLYCYNNTQSSYQSQSKIVFGAGITENMIRFEVVRNEETELTDVIMFIGNNGDQITLEYYGDDWAQGITQIEFADGTVWADLRDKIISTQYGTNDDDYLEGSKFSNHIYGGDGNDHIVALKGDNYLNGGAGDDTIEGGYGTFQGGTGNDVIRISGKETKHEYGWSIFNHDSTILFNLGDGQDEVWSSGTSGSNTIQFGAGITADMISFEYDGEMGLKILIDNQGDQITLKYYLAEPDVLSYNLKFADGTIIEDFVKLIPPITHQGTDGDDHLEGTSLRDIMYGGNGNDILAGGAGENYLDGGAGDDLLDGAYGTFKGGKGNDTIYASGKSVLNDEGWYTRVQDSTFIFDLGDGQDEIWVMSDGGNGSGGGQGKNTIQFGEGITSDMVSFEYDGEQGLRILIGNQGDQITLKHYLAENGTLSYSLKFVDGTLVEDIRTLIPSITHQGTDGDDSMYGTSLYDIMYGGDGNDVMMSSHGTFKGGKGNDTIYASGQITYDRENMTNIVIHDSTFLFDLGDGQDEIYALDGTEGQKIIRFGEGITSDMISIIKGNEADGTEADLIIIVGNQGDQISLKYCLNDASGLPYRLEFADGTVMKNIDAIINNLAPTVESIQSDLSVNEKDYFSVVLSESLFEDPVNGDLLTYKITLADGSALPSWLTYNAETRTLSGIPQNDQVGDLNFKITATDPEGLSASQEFKLTFNNVNDAPIAQGSLTEQSLKEGEAWQFALPIGSFTDIDKNDVLTYSLKMADGSDVPSWLEINAQTGLVSGVPTGSGSLGIRIVATDQAGATASHTLDLNIGALVVSNQVPTVNNTLGNQSIDEKAPFSIVLPENLFSDPDGDQLAFSISLADGSALPSWLTYNAETRTLSGIPQNDQVGDLNFKITATDPKGLSVSQEFKLTVHNVNDAPTAQGSLTEQTLKEGEPWQFALPSGSFTDIDKDDVLTYSLKMADGSGVPSWLKINTQTGLISGTPTGLNSLGLVIVATDKAGSQATHTLDLKVVDQNAIYGTSENDVITTSTGHDRIFGGSGDDIINAGSGNDYVEAGKGNDYITDTKHDGIDGGGDDTYMFRQGDGQDILMDQYGNDTVIFNDLKLEDARFMREGDHLIIYGHGEDKLTINHFFFHSNYQVENFQFADQKLALNDFWKNGLPLFGDGETRTINGWGGVNIIYGGSGAEIITTKAGNDRIFGGPGDDIINAGSGNDYVEAGKGNDYITDTKHDGIDGGGDDTYMFRQGDGQDILMDQYGNDTVIFNDLKLEDARFMREGDHLIIYGHGEDKLTINHFFFHSNYQIENIQFADYKLTINDFWQNGVSLFGKGETHTFSGANKDRAIYGGAGDDIIQGSGTLNGGAGNDKITGTGANNVFIGGTGNDVFSSAQNTNDTYLFNLGDGQDIINNDRGNDKIIFGEDVTTDMIHYEVRGNDLIIKVGSNGDQITLIHYLNPDKKEWTQTVNRFEFADGTVWEDIRQTTLTQYYPDTTNTITGTPWDDVIYAGSGNDTITDNSGNNIIYGGAGNDTITGKGTIIGGAGNDWINATVIGSDDRFHFNLGDGQDTIINRGGVDKIIFGEGITSDMISYRKDGNNLYIVMGNNGDQIVLSNYFDITKYSNGQNIYQTIHQMEFADGSTWNFYDQQAKVFVDYTHIPTVANIANQVNSLITAMAVFAPESGSMSSLPTHTYDPNSVMLASSAA